MSADELLTSAQEALWRVTKITRQVIGLYNRTAQIRGMQVPDVVAHILDNLGARIRMRNLRLEQRLELCEFYGVELDLRQLVAALVENAVEQGNTKVWIRLYSTVSRDGHRPGFRLVIADDGPGIPAEYRNRIFEPFFSTKTEKASGLGLWMAHGIANKYGGNIRVRTSTKEGASGTCIVVTMSSHPTHRVGS